jgi:hypothetical protein
MLEIISIYTNTLFISNQRLKINKLRESVMKDDLLHI